MVRQAKEQNFELSDNVAIKIYLVMPDSWSKKKKETMLYQPHKVKPDIDNTVKLIFDVLRDNDSDIYCMKVAKYWSYENKIEIRNEVNYVDIF